MTLCICTHKYEECEVFVENVVCIRKCKVYGESVLYEGIMRKYVENAWCN